LGVFVLFIYHLLNVINFQPKLLVVLF
jgi:hypothetical protein